MSGILVHITLHAWAGRLGKIRPDLQGLLAACAALRQAAPVRVSLRSRCQQVTATEMGFAILLNPGPGEFGGQQ